MFEIESIKSRMVRIDDTFIPAVNIQIEGFPCVIDGDEYLKYFEVLWEVEDHTWQVEEFRDGRISLVMFGPLGCLMDAKVFGSWSEFKGYYLAVRVDPYRGWAFSKLFTA